MTGPRDKHRSPGSGGRFGMTLAGGIVVAAFLLSPFLASRLHPNQYEGGRNLNQSDIVQRNTSAIGIILGEFRSSMSDLMYIKTERYLDRGIAYYPHIDMDAMSSEGKVVTKAGKESPGHEHEGLTTGTTRVAEIQYLQGHEHDGETSGELAAHAGEENYTKTVIREAADDFRGFIGYLERHVKPWRDPREPHQHTTGTELLPWFRLQTLSDPHNVRSYLIGAWWLKTKGGIQLEEALKFSDEGIRNNPGAFQLYLMRGSILRSLRREADSLPAFEKAVELALALRPPEGDDNANAEQLGWDRYKEQDCRTAARMAVLMAKEIGERDHALTLAQSYLATFKTDGVLERQVRILTGQEPDPAAAKNSGT